MIEIEKKSDYANKRKSSYKPKEASLEKDPPLSRKSRTRIDQTKLCGGF